MKAIKKISVAIPCALLLASALVLPGCSQDDDLSDSRDLIAAAFSAEIKATGGQAIPQSRTSVNGEQWTTDDKVGIFMLTTGGRLTSPANILADNVECKASTAAAISGFAPADAARTIYYPLSVNVDFIAYYPYGNVSGGIYNVSVADQSTPLKQAAIDLLYAKTINVARTKTPVNLAFEHVMSKITLNVTLGQGLTALTGADITAVSFSGMPLNAALALQEGTLTPGTTGDFSLLKAQTASGGAAATFTALVVPQANGTGRKAVFTVGGSTFTWNIPDTETFAPGTHYTYAITVKLLGVTASTPTITDWIANDNGNGAVDLTFSTVRIPAGTFIMGSPTTESGRGSDETQHQVTLTKDFYMGKYEVTTTQYAAFLNAKGIGSDARGSVTYYSDYFGTVTQYTVFINPSNNTVVWDGGKWVVRAGYENHPVVQVTWCGAKAFADWAGGSLPTEAQWEYACRAGTSTAFSYGDTPNGDYMWYGSNSGYSTQPVGTRLPNPWGLYDMHGNVAEWCSDGYAAYSDTPVTDPIGPAPYERVARGGSMTDSPRYCRSAMRSSFYIDAYPVYIGLRVVFVP